MIEPFPLEQSDSVLKQLNDRFGIPRLAFSGLVFGAASKRRVFLLSPEAAELALQLKARAAGLLVARVHKTVKPSTNLLQLLEKHISKSKIQLSESQGTQAMQGLDLALSESQQTEATDGYVALFLGSVCLGCGHKRGADVKNMIPKGKRITTEI